MKKWNNGFGFQGGLTGTARLISSLNNDIVKFVASLQTKKGRDETKLFIAEGVRLAAEAAASGWQVEACFYTDEAAANDAAYRVLAAIINQGGKAWQVTPAVLRKMAETETPQGLLAVVRQRRYTLDVLMELPCGLVVVLDGLQNPGNVGTVIRNADAAGCDAVLLTAGCADVFSGKAVRASMGSVFHLPIVADLKAEEIGQILSKRGFRVIVSLPHAERDYLSEDYRGPVAIVFGSEARGVSGAISQKHTTVSLPLYGRAESLNVAAASAVLLYEAARQRHVRRPSV